MGPEQQFEFRGRHVPAAGSRRGYRFPGEVLFGECFPGPYRNRRDDDFDGGNLFLYLSLRRRDPLSGQENGGQSQRHSRKQQERLPCFSTPAFGGGGIFLLSLPEEQWSSLFLFLLSPPLPALARARCIPTPWKTSGGAFADPGCPSLRMRYPRVLIPTPSAGNVPRAGRAEWRWGS